MRKRRPPRAWVGVPKPADPTELAGPRGLTAEVLAGEESILESKGGHEGAPERGHHVPDTIRDWQFYWSLLSEQRKARILGVIEARLASVTVVLDRLLDPHNTAAILRTSEGLGLCTVHVVAHEQQDALAHRRVTQDAHKWLDVAQHPSGAQAAAALKARGFDVWAGHLDEKARLYDDLPSDRPLALLFGNEHEGPSRETLQACTGTFRIPMAGFTQSFNVSVAAGIALASAAEKRRKYLKAAGDLPEEARVQLQERFTLLAAKLARRVRKT